MRNFSPASRSSSPVIPASTGRHISRSPNRSHRARARVSGTRPGMGRIGRACRVSFRWSIASGERMRELRISKRADPAYVEAFRTLIQRLLRSTGSKGPIAMYLAGGAAMHLYTGARMTDDVDAVFSRKLLVPADLAVIYRDAEGKARAVFFDVNYNETYALLHEDAHRDAVRLPLKGIRGARIFVLQPVDLAVSKLARFADIDREDILELARNRLITARGLRERAEAALPYYVGNPIPVRTSIDIACRDIGPLERAGKHGRKRNRERR